MQSPEAIYQKTSSSLGVPGAEGEVSGLRQAITNTTNLLNQVAPSVYGRTQNSLETNAQASREIQNEQAPISKTLSEQTAKEGEASTNLNNLLSKVSTLSTLSQQGQAQQLDALQKIYDNLSAKEKAQADAALEQQKLEEQKREADLSASTSKSTAASQQKAAAQAAQQQVAGQINTNLMAVRGHDGYVSPQDYQAAANDWVRSGYNLNDFKNYFAHFKNPDNAYYFG